METAQPAGLRSCPGLLLALTCRLLTLLEGQAWNAAISGLVLSLAHPPLSSCAPFSYCFQSSLPSF